MFKKFGENPPAYAIVIGSVTAVAFYAVNIVADGKGDDVLAVIAGVTTGVIVYFIGRSEYEADQTNKEIARNIDLQETAETYRYSEELDVEIRNYYEGMHVFERRILYGFYKRTGYTLIHALYDAEMGQSSDQWVLNIFNDVIEEYAYRQDPPGAKQIDKASDFLVYKIIKHHPVKQDFQIHAKRGLKYLLNKYQGEERRRIEKLITLYDIKI